MVQILEFFYNNFIIIGVIVVSVVATVILMRTFYKEFRFNRKLRFKQGVLRNFNSLKNTRVLLKSFYKIGLPLLIPFVFILAVVRSPIIYDDHIHYIEEKRDLLELHDAYHSKFYSSTTQDVDQIQIKTMLEESYTQSTKLDDNIDFVVHNDQYFAVTDGENVHLVDQDRLNVSKKLIGLSEGSNESVIGLYINDEILYVISQNTFNHVKHDADFFKAKTFIRTYDLESQSLTNTFEFSGSLTHIAVFDDRFLMTSDQPIPYNLVETERFEQYLPYYQKNNQKTIQSYDEMQYIEGANPSNYLTIFMLDLNRHSVSFTTTITNHDSRVQLSEEGVFLTSKSYLFKSASDYVEMNNPVEQDRDFISKFIIKNGDVSHFRTRMLDGKILDNGFIVDGNLTLTFVENEDGVSAYRFSQQLDIFHRTPVSHLDTIDTLHLHRHVLYAKTSADHVRLFDVSRPTEFSSFSPGYTTVLPNNILFNNARDLLLSMNISEDKIHITPFSFENHVMRHNDYSLVRTSYRQSMLSTYYNEHNVVFNEDQQRLYFPVINGDQVGDSIDFKTKVFTYEWDEDSQQFTIEQTIDLPIDIHQGFPFIYRNIILDDYVIHVTPLGIVYHNLDIEDYNDYRYLIFS